LLRQPLLMLARSPQLKDLVTRMPVSSGLVARYVPGERTTDAVQATRDLVSDGRLATLDFLGEDTLDEARAEATVDAYVDLLDALNREGLARHAEVSVKLSAIGQALPEVGPKVSLENARRICAAARTVGTTVTLDMEDSGTVDSTLAVLAELRRAHPGTGAVLQAMLHRTEDDARALAVPGSRVRLVKGAYREPPAVAFQGKADVDAAYARCLEVLVRGSGYPMAGTHDPAMIARMLELVTAAGRAPDSYEFQLLYGIRPQEQARLAAAGHTVRAYVPYGADWYGYFMRRLAERPANLQFFLRSLVTKS
jgi:proline dehydrogenase